MYTNNSTMEVYYTNNSTMEVYYSMYTNNSTMGYYSYNIYLVSDYSTVNNSTMEVACSAAWPTTEGALYGREAILAVQGSHSVSEGEEQRVRRHAAQSTWSSGVRVHLQQEISRKEEI